MNTSDSNIRIFNESAALIFSELYKNFPVPISLNYITLSNTLDNIEDTIDRHKILDVLINTVAWLKNSGYIWLDSESEVEVYGVVLSPKGLEVLKILPQASAGDKLTIGERLIQLKDNCSNEEKEALIQTALTEGCKLPTMKNKGV